MTLVQYSEIYEHIRYNMWNPVEKEWHFPADYKYKNLFVILDTDDIPEQVDFFLDRELVEHNGYADLYDNIIKWAKDDEINRIDRWMNQYVPLLKGERHKHR